MIQTPGEIIAAEGQTITLNCNFTTSSSTNQYLFWYKKDKNTSPQFILSQFKFGSGKIEDEFEQRFSSRLDSSSNSGSVPLKIQKLDLTDSAVYYCALQPTVTGNSKTLNKNLWSKQKSVLF